MAVATLKVSSAFKEPPTGLRASPAFATFCGDDDGLVDRLIASCEKRLTKPGPLNCRNDLVLYFSAAGGGSGEENMVTGKEMKPPHGVKRGGPTGSRRSPGRVQPVVTSSLQNSKRRKAAANNNMSGRVLPPLMKDGPLMKGGKDGLKVVQAKSTKVTPDFPPRDVLVKAKSAPGAVAAGEVTVWAGPGFCVSPAPSSVPMPTRALLSGAT